MNKKRGGDQTGHTTVAMAGKRDFIASACFILLWLIPMALVGLRNDGILPIVTLTPKKYKRSALYRHSENIESWFNNNYRVACLFTKAIGSWSNYYAEIQLEGESTWTEMHRDDYGRMTVFGYRTRISRMYSKAARSNHPWYVRRREDIVEFIKNRYEELHPEERVAGVRMVRVIYKTGYDQIASPAGHWAYPPLKDVKRVRKHVRLIKKEFRFDE